MRGMAEARARSYGRLALPVIDLGRASRVAIIADVHGNAVALAAVLEEIGRATADAVIVNGDLSWGPEPEETLALAGGIDGAVFVHGNAESALLRLADAPETERSDTETWMLEHHSADALRQIEKFAGAAAVEVDGLGRIFICHGSPRGDQEIVTPETPDERMRTLSEGIAADVLVTAHVHLQFQRPVLGVTSVNAGSVGLPYGASPAAYWAELGPEIRFRNTAYDLDEAERRIRASGIPTADRLVTLMREPPTAEDVIAHGEALEVSD
jgi:predicted phosphodiesterase